MRIELDERELDHVEVALVSTLAHVLQIMRRDMREARLMRLDTSAMFSTVHDQVSRFNNVLLKIRDQRRGKETL
jgi:hypothetical protein